ncbi:MAG: ferredoxin-type protein NapF [Magnetospiraceae bacterium]
MDIRYDNQRVSRRNFLRAKAGQAAHVPLRPPWALAEKYFQEACSRCGRCQAACAERIVVEGDGGFPEIDFHKGECSFCGDCVSVCDDGALQKWDAAPPWSYRAAITVEDCLSLHRVMCRTCGDACPSGAIQFQLQVGGVARPQVSLEQCTGCGACVGPCPTRVVYIHTPPVEAEGDPSCA